MSWFSLLEIKFHLTHSHLLWEILQFKSNFDLKWTRWQILFIIEFRTTQFQLILLIFDMSYLFLLVNLYLVYLQYSKGLILDRLLQFKQMRIRFDYCLDIRPKINQFTKVFHFFGWFHPQGPLASWSIDHQATIVWFQTTGSFQYGGLCPSSFWWHFKSTQTSFEAHLNNPI